MKKTIAWLLVLAMMLSLVPMTMAAETSATINVTISIAGTLQLVQESVTVTDQDSDGKLTINDAMIAAHTQSYSSGKSGYTTKLSIYGLYVTKLWGVDNGGSYGCYINNAMCFSLTDTIKTGDSIYAYSFKDLENFNDSYSWFNQSTATVEVGGSLTLTLYQHMYDENYNAQQYNCGGAVITVNGTATDFVTNEDGQVTIDFDEKGVYTVSAVNDQFPLVPPVCVVTVGDAKESTEKKELVNPFTDVPENQWYTEFVLEAVSRGLFNGTSATTFSPNSPTTRAQFAKIMYSMAKSVAKENGDTVAAPSAVGILAASKFTDVKAGQWYTEGIAWAVENGVMNGYSSTKFGTNDYITREQLLKVLYEVAGKPAVSGSLSGFSDASKVSSWAKDAVIWGVQIGLIQGSDGKLDPQGNATRAQLAKILTIYWPQD